MKKYYDDLISIIIPVYNSEKFLPKTIDSILQQTYQLFEIIIIDDGSTDNSESIINNFMKLDSRIKYHKTINNSGAAVARNIGLSHSQGEYVAFIDSDDVWLKDKLETQILFMKTNKYDFSFTAFQMVDESSKIIKEKVNVKNMIDYNFLLKNTMIATSTVMINIKNIGLFEMPNIRSGQDYATWLMLLRKRNAYGINKVGTIYKVRKNSLSSNKFKSIKQVWMIQRKFEKINPIKVFINIMYFCINAIKKHI